MRQTETHRCHLRHDERLQRCVIMLNYSHMQISCILAVIAHNWKHRYSICIFRQTGPWWCIYVCVYLPYVVWKCLLEHVLCNACVNMQGWTQQVSRYNESKPFAFLTLNIPICENMHRKHTCIFCSYIIFKCF